MLHVATLNLVHIAFDDHRLISNAGLILPATLALHLGLLLSRSGAPTTRFRAFQINGEVLGEFLGFSCHGNTGFGGPTNSTGRAHWGKLVRRGPKPLTASWLLRPRISVRTSFSVVLLNVLEVE